MDQRRLLSHLTASKSGANHAGRNTMLDFYQTVGGRRFIDGTMPKLVKSLEVIAKHLQRTEEKKEVLHILDSLIDGKPDDPVGAPLSRIREYVENT